MFCFHAAFLLSSFTSFQAVLRVLDTLESAASSKEEHWSPIMGISCVHCEVRTLFLCIIWIDFMFQRLSTGWFTYINFTILTFHEIVLEWSDEGVWVEWTGSTRDWNKSFLYNFRLKSWPMRKIWTGSLSGLTLLVSVSFLEGNF
jgi:hypothetical protein